MLGICVFLVSILLLLLTWNYMKNIKEKAENNKREVVGYGKGIIIGIISGIIVLSLDRWINIVVRGLSEMGPIRAGSLLEIVISLVSTLVYLLFASSVLLFLVFYLINSGLGPDSRTR